MEKMPRWALIRRRLVWMPTWRGWLIGLVVLCPIFWMLFKGLHTFLTVVSPVTSDTIVVEGWAPDYAFKKAADEFKAGHCKRIYVTGGPLEKGAPLSRYKTYAELGAAVTTAFGVDTQAVQAVPASEVMTDRTYASARALSLFFAKQKPATKSLNVISIGPHSRRTRLMFMKAFDPDWEIGSIPVQDENYDAAHWYRSSNGVRAVSDEFIAYLYAKLLFHPPKPQSESME